MTPIVAPTLAPLVLPRTSAEPIDPADFAPLRDYLDRYGTLTIDPRDPPWADPRPDLVDDHSRWWLVLEAAWRIDGQDPYGVYGALVGMRCCGARLELAAPANRTRSPAGQPETWRLLKGDELSEEEYQQYRQTYLVPHTATIRKLLNAPEAGQLAHPRPAAPRRNGQDPAAQPALLEVAPVPAPATMAGGDW